VASFLVAVRVLPLALAAIVPIGLAFLANFTMTRLVVFPDSGRHRPPA
jgi:putative flippase GtrA